MKLRSFSLVETLASIILLSILVSNFSNLATTSSNYLNHNTIQTLNNQINENSFTNYSSTKVNIDFTIQSDSELKYINGNTYKKYTYDNDLKLIYYDIDKKEATLASKIFE